MAELQGFDVSYCQDPALVPWGDDRIAFGIVKGTEACTEDSKVKQHVARIRAAGKKLGLYHFFHPDVAAKAQFEAFDWLCASVAYGHDGDIVPAVDVEYFKGHEVKPTWNALAQEFCDMLDEAFEGRCMLYMSESTWVCLGRPTWVLEHPLWVPLYVRDGFPPPKELSPRFVPGAGQWCIWQNYVGPLFGSLQDTKARGAVDHNIARRLPLIGEVPS